MKFEKMRRELYDFYLCDNGERSKNFADKCFAIMDEHCTDNMSITQQKLLQYDVITQEFDPAVFKYNPFFYETGVLTSLSDGSRNAKGYSFIQANGWVFNRNKHVFARQDRELYKNRCNHIEEFLYLICGEYNDTDQHFNFNCTPFLELGIKGIYEKAENEIQYAKNDEEKEFLSSVCHGMLALKAMAEKFALKANEMLAAANDEECRDNLKLIAKTASRVPWEAPQNLYEALATLAFMRTAMGSLEGVGPNTFGRLDKDLIKFYNSDIENGSLTHDKAYDIICQFLLIWDCHYDHNMLMEGYADHELENTYTLGGCNEDGTAVYNELTKMFLRATRENGIIFPKIKCRFSKNSPKEYLDEINTSVISGMSTVLYANDDAIIPAILKSGRTLSEARDYRVSGCWGIVSNQEKYDHGSYLNLMKPFEYSIHNLTDKMAKTGLYVELLDDCEDFEELYRKTIANIEKLIELRMNVTRKGGQIFHKADRFPIFSSTLEACMENHRDFTMNGAKYHDDYLLMFGLPNIVDSLLAIKELVFESKKYTLKELLEAVRCNWAECDEMRADALSCPGWGDGSAEGGNLAKKLNTDLYEICSRQEGTYGGRVNFGHLTYTEIRWWGEQMLAFPDGRKSGECFAQGLTPSRLKRIPCVNDVINSLTMLDSSVIAAGSVVNVILPGDVTADYCEAFLRVASQSSLQTLQLNCVSKETLLDAQKHPEKYPDLIVRVTGFSAKFTSLSKEWQEEVLSRNFYR